MKLHGNYCILWQVEQSYANVPTCLYCENERGYLNAKLMSTNLPESLSWQWCGDG